MILHINRYIYINFPLRSAFVLTKDRILDQVK